MKNKKIIGRISGWLLLGLGIPILFFALLEGLLLLLPINDDIVSSNRFKVGIPLWAHDQANFNLASDIYKQVLNNELPASSVEWLKCFVQAQDIHYKMKPNLDAWVMNSVNRFELKKGLKVRFKSNSLGFRSAEIAQKKPPGVYRIAFLGDSTVFGWGVQAGERFSDLLAERLNQRHDGRCYEVLNFAIPGYTSLHGLEVYRRYALDFSPDMVMVSFGANDGRLVPKAVKQLLGHRSILQGLKNFLVNFKTYRLLRKWMFSLYNPFDHLKQTETQAMEPFITLDEYCANLQAIIDENKQRSIRTVFLSLCSPIDYLAKMSAVAQREGIPEFDGMYVLLQSIAAIQNDPTQKKNISYYQRLYGPKLLRERRILYVTSDTCHPNRIGHQVLADFLYERLFGEGSSVQ